MKQYLFVIAGYTEGSFGDVTSNFIVETDKITRARIDQVLDDVKKEKKFIEAVILNIIPLE